MEKTKELNQGGKKGTRGGLKAKTRFSGFKGKKGDYKGGKRNLL